MNMYELKSSAVMALEPRILYQMLQRREAEIIPTFTTRYGFHMEVKAPHETGSLLLV